MKRFLIFLLLVPMLGFLVFLLHNVFAGKIVGGFTGFVFGLPFAYLLSCGLRTGFVRQNWARNESRHICCEGYVASIAMLLLTSALQLQLPQILSFGIVGAIPAAVCSWLAGTTENRGTSRQ